MTPELADDRGTGRYKVSFIYKGHSLTFFFQSVTLNGELYRLCQPFSGNYTFNHLHCMIVRHAFHPISHMWLMKFSSFIFAQQLPIFNSLLHSALVFKPPEETFPLFNANFWSRSCIFSTFLKSDLPCSYPLLPPNMSWKQTAAVVLKKPSSTFNTAEAWPSLTLWWPSIPQLPHDGLLNTAASATSTRTGRGPRSGSLSVRQIQPHINNSYQCLLCLHI